MALISTDCGDLQHCKTPVTSEAEEAKTVLSIAGKLASDRANPCSVRSKNEARTSRLMRKLKQRNPPSQRVGLRDRLKIRKPSTFLSELPDFHPLLSRKYAMSHKGIDLDLSGDVEMCYLPSANTLSAAQQNTFERQARNEKLKSVITKTGSEPPKRELQPRKKSSKKFVLPNAAIISTDLRVDDVADSPSLGPLSEHYQPPISEFFYDGSLQFVAEQNRNTATTPVQCEEAITVSFDSSTKQTSERMDIDCVVPKTPQNFESYANGVMPIPFPNPSFHSPNFLPFSSRRSFTPVAERFSDGENGKQSLIAEISMPVKNNVPGQNIGCARSNSALSPKAIDLVTLPANISCQTDALNKAGNDNAEMSSAEDISEIPDGALVQEFDDAVELSASAGQMPNAEQYEFIYTHAVVDNAGALTQCSESSVAELTTMVTLTQFVPILPIQPVRISLGDKVPQSVDSVQATQNMADEDEECENQITNLRNESPEWGNSPACNASKRDAVTVDEICWVLPPPVIDSDFVAVLADLGINVETDFQPGRNNRVLNTINAITNFKTDAGGTESKAACQLLQFDEHVPNIVQQLPARETTADGVENFLYFVYEINIDAVSQHSPADNIVAVNDIGSAKPLLHHSCQLICASLLPKLPAITVYSETNQQYRVTMSSKDRTEPQNFSKQKIDRITFYHSHWVKRQDFPLGAATKNYFVMPSDIHEAITSNADDFLLLLPRILHRFDQLLVAEEFRQYWASQIGLNTSQLSTQREWPTLLGRACPPERQEALYGNKDDVEPNEGAPIDAAQAKRSELANIAPNEHTFRDECGAAMQALVSQVKQSMVATTHFGGNVENKTANFAKRTVSMMSIDNYSVSDEVSLENLTLLSQLPLPLLSSDERSAQIDEPNKSMRIADETTSLLRTDTAPTTNRTSFNIEPLVTNTENSQMSVIDATRTSTVRQSPLSADKDFEIVDGVRRRVLPPAVKKLIAQHHFDDAWFCETGGDETDVEQRARVHALLADLRGPHPGLILQALTAKSARDHFNFERLEMVGDSALNLFISIYLFARFPDHDQGKLMFANHVLVSNKLLATLAEPHGIGQRVVVQSFPSIPACNIGLGQNTRAAVDDVENEFAASQESLGTAPPSPSPPPVQWTGNACSKKFIEPKVISDCVEALIGAYLISSGPFVARLFMHAFGINVFRFPPVDDADDTNAAVHRRRPTVAEIVQEFSERGLDRLVGLPTNGMLPEEIDYPELLIPMMGGFDKLEAVIGYTFRDKSFLVQALTHQSFRLRNPYTACYERLEVLGDALVEYLVTVFIYRRCPNANPARIHLIRKALVGNVFFATVMVRNRLYRFLKLSSKHPSWRKMIAFAKYVLKPIDAAIEAEKKRAALMQSAEEKLCCDLSKPITPGDDVEAADYSTNIADETLIGTFSRAKHVLCGTKIIDVYEVLDEDRVEVKMKTSTPPLPPKCLGDMLESIAGAIYVDSGGSLDACWRYLCHIMGDDLIARTTPKKRETRHRPRKTKSKGAVKSAVIRLSSKPGGKNVQYFPLPAAPDRQSEVVVVLVNRRIGFCGVAKTEEIAREAAAQCALEYLETEKRTNSSEKRSPKARSSVYV